MPHPTKVSSQTWAQIVQFLPLIHSQARSASRGFRVSHEEAVSTLLSLLAERWHNYDPGKGSVGVFVRLVAKDLFRSLYREYRGAHPRTKWRDLIQVWPEDLDPLTTHKEDPALKMDLEARIAGLWSDERELIDHFRRGQTQIEIARALRVPKGEIHRRVASLRKRLAPVLQ